MKAKGKGKADDLQVQSQFHRRSSSISHVYSANSMVDLGSSRPSFVTSSHLSYNLLAYAAVASGSTLAIQRRAEELGLETETPMQRT